MIVVHYNEIVSDVQALAKKFGRDPQDIKIVVVSKLRSIDDILNVYQLGCRDFGENRVQEFVEKRFHCPKDINWHFIGTLQSNKIKKIVGQCALIHSVNSLELVGKIAEFSYKEKMITPLLLQVNTSGEKTKHGLSPDEWMKSFSQLKELPNLKFEGLMTMAPLTEDKVVIRNCFRRLKEFQKECQRMMEGSFKDLSMGMSHDYPIAIEEGATILRIGSAIYV